MDRLAQVGAGRLIVEIGPEGGHHLLAMETMGGREGEQLDKRGGAIPLPCFRGNRDAVDADVEPAEEIYGNLHAGVIQRCRRGGGREAVTRLEASGNGGG